MSIGGFEGGKGELASSNTHCAPTSGGTLGKEHYEHVQHFASLCSVD